MRKLSVFVLILSLCLGSVLFGTCAAEGAEVPAEKPVLEPSDLHLEFVLLPEQKENSTGYTYYLNSFTNNLLRVGFSEGYTLTDASGTVLSSVYDEMISGRYVCRVANQNRWGAIDGRTGEELVPCMYDHIEEIVFLYGENDGSWILGMHLEAGTADDHDYRDVMDPNKYYRIVSTDLYHGTKLLKTFPREQYNINSTFTLFGKYIYHCADRKGARISDIYDLDFNPVRQGVEGTSEFVKDYSTGIITHIPTGQQAFTAGCTLTPDDVYQRWWIENNQIIALNGDVVCAPEKEYDWISVTRPGLEYFQVSLNGLYGIIDLAGNEVIPCVCESFTGRDWFVDGYLAAVVDGKLVFFDEAGTVVSRPDVDADNFTILNGIFGFTQTEDGYYRIFSAEAGLLEGVYEYPTAAGKLIAVGIGDDQYAILDSLGKVVVPFGEFSHSFFFSSDGSVIMAHDADYDSLIALVPEQ